MIEMMVCVCDQCDLLYFLCVVFGIEVLHILAYQGYSQPLQQ